MGLMMQQAMTVGETLTQGQVRVYNDATSEGDRPLWHAPVIRHAGDQAEVQPCAVRPIRRTVLVPRARGPSLLTPWERAVHITPGLGMDAPIIICRAGGAHAKGRSSSTSPGLSSPHSDSLCLSHVLGPFPLAYKKEGKPPCIGDDESIARRLDQSSGLRDNSHTHKPTRHQRLGTLSLSRPFVTHTANLVQEHRKLELDVRTFCRN